VRFRADFRRGGRVTHQADAGPELGKIFQNILLFALVALLPGLDWSIFGWLHGILPLLTFIYLCRYGFYVGNRLVLTGGVIALIGSLLLQAIEPMLLSLSLMPAGYALAHAAKRGDSPSLAGLKGLVTLGGCWLGIIGLFSVAREVPPYTVFLGSIDQGIIEALEYYRQSESVSVDALAMLETTFHQMRIVLPLIMPSILAGFVLLTIWFSMVVGNVVLNKIGGTSPWPKYQLWQLPERVVWVVIAGAAFALLPFSSLKVFGINLLIFISLIYCFQGLAIISYYLHTWNVPIFLRSFLYVIVVFQSFGTILLLGLGLADVWLDFRKLKKPPEIETADTTST